MQRDDFWMQQAISLARQGWGQTRPNPLVGCVIVRGDQILSEGFHAALGQPHAEREAILRAKQRGIDLGGSSLYVNLEPCSHHGRTPPCTEAIIEAGIGEVIVAMVDPNPLVAGRGIKLLRQAGIRVRTGILETEARQLNEIFCKFITSRKPFVLLKTAVSLDGKIATWTGDSKWISGEASRSVVHQWRDRLASIVTGRQTILRDNPALDTRRADRVGRNPVRIIVDSEGRIPLDARVLHAGDPGVILATTTRIEREKQAAFEHLGVDILKLDGPDGRVDLPLLVHEIGLRGLDSMMLEGGGTLNASFLQAGLVDKLMLFMAPKLIGGKQAFTFFDGEGSENLSQAIAIDRMSVSPCGGDWLIEGYLTNAMGV